ncbi:MAG: hypothetical protein GY817_08960 [bacterium]|nr:hypothetical protein [bacterium]
MLKICKALNMSLYDIIEIEEE